MSDTGVEVDFGSQEFANHFGGLLSATRHGQRRSIRDIATGPDARFSATRLRQLERGSLSLDEAMIGAACEVYGADLGTLLPTRLPISIRSGEISAGGIRAVFQAGDPTALLTAYLRLIRTMRRQRRSPAVLLRRMDIELLARWLGTSNEEVVERLASLMGATAVQRHAMRSLLAAGAIVIGLAAVSVSSASVASAGASSAPQTVQAPSAPSASKMITAVSAADGDGLLPAVRTTAQPAAQTGVSAVSAEAAPQVTLPGVVNRSDCKADPATEVMHIVIPDISYDCPVYAGGQTQIDGGLVTMVTDVVDKSLATQPGAAGTLWLAAHRNTSGGAFAAVPDLKDGALILVASGATVVTYRVVGRARAEVRDGLALDSSGATSQSATLDALFRVDRNPTNAPRLVLQTCDGANYRWMIYADLVTG